MLKIIENASGNYTIGDGAGLVRTTEGSVFMTRNWAAAEDALAFLSQAPAGGKRRGSNRLKSMFGVIA